MPEKFINTCLLASFFVFAALSPDSLKNEQLRSSRVKRAYNTKWQSLKKQLEALNIAATGFDVYIRAFKQEKTLETWVKNTGSNKFVLFKRYAICASSGKLGPKRQQGDLQVPEGFYKIPSLHPYSNYHLALKVGYPNHSDLLKTTATDPGGDIMIHGKCVTIGCIPLQDEPVEEVYLLALEAMNRNRTVSCDIYPCQLTETAYRALQNEYDNQTTGFWLPLKKAYEYFELNHSLPQITVNKKGDYEVNVIK